MASPCGMQHMFFLLTEISWTRIRIMTQLITYSSMSWMGHTTISQDSLLKLCQDMMYVMVCHWFYQQTVSSDEAGQGCDEVRDGLGRNIMILIYGWVSVRWNSSVLAMELCLSCITPVDMPIYMTIQALKAGLKIYATAINIQSYFIKSTAWHISRSSLNPLLDHFCWNILSYFGNQVSLTQLQAPWGVTHKLTAWFLPSGHSVVM